MSTKKKSKVKKWMITGVIIVAIVGVIGSYLAKPAPSSYESVKAKTGDITNYYSFSGNVESKNSQTILSDNVMQISDIKVNDGDQVNEGDVLITTTAGKQIKAPIDGEIVDVNVEEDAQIMSGMELLKIVDYDHLQVSVKVDEFDLAAVEKGKETTVKIAAINKEIKGEISSISKEGKLENGITFFTATIDLEKDDSLKIGLSTEVKLLNNKVSNVVTLPMNAISFDDNNKPYVFKKAEDDTSKKVQIITGINDGITVEIKKGVSNNETILYTKANAAESTGFMSNRPNQPGTGGDVN